MLPEWIFFRVSGERGGGGGRNADAPRSEFTGNSVDEMPQQDAIPCGGTATKLLAVSAAPVEAVGR